MPAVARYLVGDFSPDEFKNNVLALADAAKYFNLPTILTTSFENGPNGPLVPELKALFPDAPYIARPGQINAWDNDEFVKAVEDTGADLVIMASHKPGLAEYFWPSNGGKLASHSGVSVLLVRDA